MIEMSDQKMSGNAFRGALCAPLIFSATVLLASSAWSADDAGKFAIKGGGQQTCGKFLEAMEAKSTDVALYGGWVEGYITAQNQVTADTFDLAPWQTTTTLLGMVKSVCSQSSPDARFMDAAVAIIRLLSPGRLTQESEVVGISNGQVSAVAYKEILRRVQIALRDEGYSIQNEDGDFDKLAVATLARYQRDKGLTPSGLPDQATLYSLFFRPAD